MKRKWNNSVRALCVLPVALQHLPTLRTNKRNLSCMGLGIISGYLLNTVNGLSIYSLAKINKRFFLCYHRLHPFHEWISVNFMAKLLPAENYTCLSQ